ncbi:MAG: hypothetical protein CMN30_30080 [Sandaracinus sp.]|nr:hypothetical protein [Sandaracinus sp.]
MAFLLFGTNVAEAYTTRVHIMLANDVRRNLIAEGGVGLRLQGSDHVVLLSSEDSEAIMEEPLAFRAGAVGPDNLVFPAMTDGSHGVEQDPYRQCESLYEAALTRTERAYALGCFLHGATDAIAHHFVNAFTGETFTLTPLSTSRLSSYHNVVGHIVTEATIQEAFVETDAARFDAGQLEHSLPQDFILRTYFALDSAVWQRLAEHPNAKLETARAADPEGDILDWAQNAGLGAWEQIALAPVYVDQVQAERAALRTFIEAEIADMQDPSSERGGELGVAAGPDGTLGTPDDTTACTSGCPSLAARYHVFVRILQPRLDAGGRELPSAFDALSDAIGDQLHGFLPALVQVIANLSAELNSPVAADGEDHGFDIDASIVSAAFEPVTDWADTLVDTTSSGFDGLADTITPAWYEDLSLFFQSLGVDITVGNVLRVLFGPLLDQIRETLVTEVVGRAQVYLEELKSAYDEENESWHLAVDTMLADSTPADADGHALERILDSGLYAYSLDLTAAAFGNHEVLLVDGDPIAQGPASFDASYTHEWTQIGRCSYLRDAVFPHGTHLAALLSFDLAGTWLDSALSDDSPAECHDGDLDRFGDPSAETCAFTTLPELLENPVGSVSRAYPPEHGEGADGCQGLTVPGLPEPPAVEPDGGPGATGDAGDTTPTSDDGGCGCATPGHTGGSAPWLLLVGLVGLLALRRRRAGAALLALLFFVGCGDDDGDTAMMDAGTPMDSAVPMDAPMTDAETPTDAGPDLRQELLEALDGTVWSGLQARDEGGALVERAYEQHFDAGELRWGEIRNPYGPGRQRVLRTFNPSVMDRELTVDSTVMIPTGWETPEPLRGRRDTWTFEVVDGDPRQLVLTDTETGIEETYAEGAWPAPEGGLLAEVRVFGSTGAVYDAYCGAGFSSWEDGPVLDFARGTSATLPLAEDVAAGTVLGEWADGVGTFAVTDLDGFARLGGTELSAQANFTVRYTGTLSHTGHLSVREEDDSYRRMASWVFVGGDVGGSRGSALHEIYHFTGDDDETVSATPTGDSVDIEVIVVWCSTAGETAFTLQQSLTSASGPWETVGTGATAALDAALFPPVL